MDPDGSRILLTASVAADSAGDWGSTLLQLLILVVLILSNAFFAASEIAIITLNDNKLKKKAEEGNKRAGILMRMTANPSNFLATIQVGVTLSGFLASAVAATSFAEKITVALDGVIPIPASVISGIATVVITLLLSFLTLVFGELVPKRIAMQRAEGISFKVAGILRGIAVVTKPFIWLLSKTTNGMLRLMGFNPDAEDESVTEEEILMMVDEGEERGVIEEATSEMISNVFEFDDITAGEIMTHRTEISAVDEEDTIADVLQIAIEEGYSRIPVYREGLDNIVGVCYVKDLLKYVGKNLPEKLPLTAVMRQTLYIPEAKKCGELLQDLQRCKVQMAVVVDEYGGTAGIVTMEDLLESIVGNIQDEFDNEEEDVVKLSDTTFTVDGTTDIDELSELLGVQLPEGDYDTVGGMLLENLGHIPKENEHPMVPIAGYSFTVEKIEERRIAKVRVEKLPEPKAMPQALRKDEPDDRKNGKNEE